MALGEVEVLGAPANQRAERRRHELEARRFEPSGKTHAGDFVAVVELVDEGEAWRRRRVGEEIGAAAAAAVAFIAAILGRQGVTTILVVRA